jgi:hypothetical protein
MSTPGNYPGLLELVDGFRLVVVESPYAGDVAKNEAYLSLCLADCFNRGEAPFASHGLYTRRHVLNDKVKAERLKGMAAGFAWARLVEHRVAYVDLGETAGMVAGREEAARLEQSWEERKLGPIWDEYLARMCQRCYLAPRWRPLMKDGPHVGSHAHRFPVHAVCSDCFTLLASAGASGFEVER